MADGSVTFETRLDNSKLEKEMNATAKKIDSLNQKIAQKEAARAPIVEALKDANKQAVEAYNNVERLQSRLAASQTATTSGNLGPTAYMQELENQKQIKAELKEQEKILKQKEAAAERLAAKDAKAVQAIEAQTAALEREKEKAGKLQIQLEQTQKMAPVSALVDGVGKKIDKFSDRIKGLMKRVFIFTLITSALRGVRDWMGRVTSTNDEATRATARLKAALLTLAQPMMEVVIPAFTTFVELLTRIVSSIAGLVSMLFGQTIEQSKEAAEKLNDEAEAIKDVGSAAKKSSKPLAAFDQLNRLSSNDGGESASTKPDFSFDTSSVEADFGKLLKWIELIGAALLSWKLSNSFTGGLKTFLGLILAINGAIELAKGTWDAWQNGVDWDNFLQMLEGAALLVAGLGIAFGPVGAAIGFIVSGLDFLATGFHDAMENGWNLQNMLMSISGIMTAGLGISILTGSFIPMLVAGIASLLLALTIATGHGEELIEGIRNICEGFVGFITGIFTGDIEKALGGINQMFYGLQMAVGASIEGVRDSILSFLDWLDEKTGGKLHWIIEIAEGFVSGFFDVVKDTALGLVESLQKIFTGLVEFIAGVFTNDWDLAWQGVKDMFGGFIEGIEYILVGGINLIVKGLNWLIDKMNGISFTVPSWVPEVGGKTIGVNIQPIQEYSIPKLASGAVIPPNREFLAVLGDQKNGTNIEAPLSTMVQAFKTAMQEGGYGFNGNMTVILEVDRQQLGRVVYTLNKEQTQRVGVSLVGV